MGNVNGRDEGENGEDDPSRRSDRESGFRNDFLATSDLPVGAASSESMEKSPPQSAARSPSPLLFASQVPVTPLQRGDRSAVFGQKWLHEPWGTIGAPVEKGIPIIITWIYGGNDVAVEGSWDNWTSRKTMLKSGKDHSILLVLPSGIYQYKFIVDGEWRYIPDIPCIADETGHMNNLLDVTDFVPDNLESIAEFEPPSSPDSSYSQLFPVEEDFTKEPAVVPPQLHLTAFGMQKSPEASSKPHHVVLNHLFIENGWASQSLVALGLTHRFQSKYVTVVLYKPLRK